MKHFFTRHQGRGSYDLFSGHCHYTPGIGGIMMLLVLFLFGALIGNLATLGLTYLAGSAFVEDFGTIVSYPIMFIPPLLYASVMSRLNALSTEAIELDRNDIIKGRTGKTVLVCMLSCVAAAFIVEPVSILLPPMPQWLKDVMTRMLENTPVWATLISVSVFAPLFEEWLCRGIVLRGLLVTMNPFSAIAVSSVFFAILHINPWQAVPAFCLGMLFGYVYYKTRSLKMAMLMHCTNNTLAVVTSRIPQLKDAETFMDVLSPWAYTCIFIACCVIVASAVVFFRQFQENQVYPRQ